MIEIVRFDHVSMAVPEVDRQVELLERLFGFRFVSRFEEDGFVGVNLAVPGFSEVAWEVLAPSGRDSYLHRFLAGPNGPGLHHVAILVRDIEQAVEAMRAEGIEPWGVRRPGDAADGAGDGYAEDDGTRGVAYIHPRQGGSGFLFQLYAGEPWQEHEPFVDTGEHTLGIKAIDHLSHAHYSREALAAWYERLFGFETVYRAPLNGAGGFATQVLDTPTRQMRWEILQPAGADSFVQRFLDRRGPSVHHVTFEVGDWQRAVEACRYHGVDTFGEREGDTEGVPWREAFIHPRDTGGMLVQFFWQAMPGAWI